MSPSSVPPELTGLWRRELITTPHLSDSTTQVVWLQTSSWYVDLRVPEDTPAADGYLTVALRLAPQNADSHYWLAVLRARQRDCTAAHAALADASALAPGEPRYRSLPAGEPPC